MSKGPRISTGKNFNHLEDELIVFLFTYYPKDWANRAMSQLPGRTKAAVQSRRSRIAQDSDYLAKLQVKASKRFQDLMKKDLFHPHRNLSANSLHSNLSDYDARKTNDALVEIADVNQKNGDVKVTRSLNEEEKEMNTLSQNKVTQVELGVTSFKVPVKIKSLEIDNNQLYAVLEIGK